MTTSQPGELTCLQTQRQNSAEFRFRLNMSRHNCGNCVFEWKSALCLFQACEAKYPPYCTVIGDITWTTCWRAAGAGVVAMEALYNNITTPIMKKQQALGGDLCRSVMGSSSLSPGWILNYTCNLWQGALGKVSWTWWRWFLTGISLVTNTSITVKIGRSYFGITMATFSLYQESMVYF